MSPGKSAQLYAVPGSYNIELTATADLRRHTRIDTFILTEAFTASGDMTIGLISNLSLSGLCLEGSRQMVDTLLPNASRHNQHIPSPIRLCFELPGTPAATTKAQVLSGTAYTRRADKDTYHIGMHFIDIEQGLEVLTEYLSASGAL